MSNLSSSRALYRRLLVYVVPYWRIFGLSLLAMVILAATQPAVPALLKPMLDGSFVDKDLGLVQSMAALLVAVFLVRGVSSYLSAVGMAWVSGRLVLDLRMAMFDKLLSLPRSVTDHTESGALISKVTFDATRVTDASTRVLTVLVSDSLTVLALLGWMFYLDSALTGIALISAPIVMLTVRYFSRKLRRTSSALQDSMGEVTHRVRETLDGAKVVRIFGGQDYERSRFLQSANWARRYQVKFASAANATGPIAQFVVSVALAIIICVTAYQASADQITIGGFVSFLAAMVLLFPPIRRLTAVNAALQQGLAASESVFALIDEASEPNYGDVRLGRVEGRIEFDAVTFQYDANEVRAVENVSFTIAPGEMVALVGPSGSGKSTLAHLLARFYEPTGGVIRVDDHDIRTCELSSLRAQMALVSQDVILFNDSVAANIAYGHYEQTDRRAILRAAEAAQLSELLAELPDGIDTRIGEGGVRLSGGQRQRIAIARAFVKDAPVLILDEATSALDSESERQIQTALERLQSGRSTLVIAHRLSTIERADRIVVMTDGRIVETGTHSELLQQGGLYAGLYRFQYADGANPTPRRGMR